MHAINLSIPDMMAELYAASDLPSEDCSRDWHVVLAPSLKQFRSTEKTGKWCVFASGPDVDSAWAKVRAAVTADRLVAAKVSTRLRRGDRNNHVICVYTRDWTDSEELKASREVLRELGFAQELGYKRDLETRKRLYGSDVEWYCWA
jgi:hypothetical protein